MESEKTLTERIMAITIEINKKYPELARYVSEMTVTIPDEKKPHINNKELNDYYNSLIEMVRKYKLKQT